jgi:virginiamycin B lyase
MWFTVNSDISTFAPAVVRITPSGKLTFFRYPNVGDTEYVAEGYDGAIWLISGGLSSTNFERIDPSGHLTQFPDPDAEAGNPISQGPGGDMWFAGIEAGDRPMIGSVTESGTITPFALPSREIVESLVQGPDGNLWFTLLQSVEGGAREHLGRMTPSGQLTLFPTPTFSCPPYGMAVGPDHALWFAEGCGKIGRVTTSGRITEFTIPGMRGCSQIVSGPDGDLWFTCNGAYPAIGKITPAGKVTVFRTPGPADAGIYGLAFSNQRTLWFTETYAAKVGRATLP